MAGSPMARTSGPGGASILVIDDDDLMRDSLKETLVRRGYAVRAAADGAAGLALLVLRRMKLPVLPEEAVTPAPLQPATAYKH